MRYVRRPRRASHHALEDIAVMRSLPNMSFCAPSDEPSNREMTKMGMYYNVRLSPAFREDIGIYDSDSC